MVCWCGFVSRSDAVTCGTTSTKCFHQIVLKWHTFLVYFLKPRPCSHQSDLMEMNEERKRREEWSTVTNRDPGVNDIQIFKTCGLIFFRADLGRRKFHFLVSLEDNGCFVSGTLRFYWVKSKCRFGSWWDFNEGLGLCYLRFWRGNDVLSNMESHVEWKGNTVSVFQEGYISVQEGTGRGYDPAADENAAVFSSPWGLNLIAFIQC